MRHSGRNIAGNDQLQEAFVRPLYLAERVVTRNRGQCGREGLQPARG